LFRLAVVEPVETLVKFVLLAKLFLQSAKAFVRALPTLSGSRPQEADSVSGGFVRHVPRLPEMPAVGHLSSAS
jgi:hypothetical protein